MGSVVIPEVLIDFRPTVDTPCISGEFQLRAAVEFWAPLALVAAPRLAALVGPHARAMPKGIPAPGAFDFPGDNVNLANEGLAEGEHIFIRMGTIVRARRLDLRLLMDAHDLHNRGFVDKRQFQRALAYAFGRQWNEVRAASALPTAVPPSSAHTPLRGRGARLVVRVRSWA
jgi:hypothetical protein